MRSLASMLRHSDRRSIEKTIGLPDLTEAQRREMNEGARLAEQQERERAVAGRMRAARIPNRYSAASLDDCEPAVSEYARAAADGHTGWLLLTGRNGRGKTHQACAVLRHLAESRRARFATMQGILDECKATFGRPESEKAVKDHYRNVPVLLLDDLGKEYSTDWSLPVIFDVIDGRYLRMKPTIITTNMGADQLLTHMTAKGGDRTMAESVVSRLGGAAVVEITGTDRRMEHA